MSSAKWRQFCLGLNVLKHCNHLFHIAPWFWWPHVLFDMVWASYQIRKIAGCTWAGNAGNVFSRHRFQRKPLVSEPGMDSGLRTQAWFIQRKIIQIQNISGHQYIKWTYVQWKGKIVTATALLHLPKTEGESPPQSAATSQWRPLRSSAYNGAFLT